MQSAVEQFFVNAHDIEKRQRLGTADLINPLGTPVDSGNKEGCDIINADEGMTALPRPGHERDAILLDAVAYSGEVIGRKRVGPEHGRAFRRAYGDVAPQHAEDGVH